MAVTREEKLALLDELGMRITVAEEDVFNAIYRDITHGVPSCPHCLGNRFAECVCTARCDGCCHYGAVA